MQADAGGPHGAASRPPLVLALAGDAMLGRAVAARLETVPRPELFSAELEAVVRSADLFVLNLECCISRRGTHWPAPGKPFFFRAPPEAAEALAGLGVDCVTLANNHALDFGPEALLDTLRHLAAAGIRTTGAGADLAAARAPAMLESRGHRVAVLAMTDHPRDFAAAQDRAGVAFADLRAGSVPGWVLNALDAARAEADSVLLMPHWGPNLTRRPPGHVRTAADVLGPRATLVAGHSAHVFHGVQGNVLYDLGDFINDYTAVQRPREVLAGVAHKLGREIAGLGSEVTRRGRAESGEGASRVTFWQLQQWRAKRLVRMLRARVLRPDLGLLFLVTLDDHGPARIEAVPLKLGQCHTDLAAGDDAAFVRRRLRRACAALGTPLEERDGRAVILGPARGLEPRG